MLPDFLNKFRNENEGKDWHTTTSYWSRPHATRTTLTSQHYSHAKTHTHIHMCVPGLWLAVVSAKLHYFLEFLFLSLFFEKVNPNLSDEQNIRTLFPSTCTAWAPPLPLKGNWFGPSGMRWTLASEGRMWLFFSFFYRLEKSSHLNLSSEIFQVHDDGWRGVLSRGSWARTERCYIFFL